MTGRGAGRFPARLLVGRGAEMGKLYIERIDTVRRLREDNSGGFDDDKRQAFLDALALTCNVRLAARYAGVDHSTAYNHRRRDPTFMAQWQDALETGYDRLEELVLQHSGAGQALAPADPNRAEANMGANGEPCPPFDFDKALAVLRMFRARRDSGRSAPGERSPRMVRPEATDAALDKALIAAALRMKRRAVAQTARDRHGDEQ